MNKEEIPLFWYSLYKFREPPKVFSTHFIRKLFDKEKENYGDLLSKYLVEKISGKRTLWYKPNGPNLKRNYLAIGSILNYADNKSNVWGSGIIDRKHPVDCDKIFAVRGPLTRNRLLDLGFDCPEVYGDPALLLPEYYKPKIKKKYRLGIVPHWMDYRKVKKLFGENPDIRIINLVTSDIEKTTYLLLECEAIISSSLHGIIVAHAYNIPAVWVKFSDDLYGDDVKFFDYLESVNLVEYNPKKILQTLTIDDIKKIINNANNLPKSLHLKNVRNGLMNSCPFL